MVFTGVVLYRPLPIGLVLHLIVNFLQEFSVLLSFLFTYST